MNVFKFFLNTLLFTAIWVFSYFSENISFKILLLFTLFQNIKFHPLLCPYYRNISQNVAFIKVLKLYFLSEGKTHILNLAIPFEFHISFIFETFFETLFLDFATELKISV